MYMRVITVKDFEVATKIAQYVHEKRNIHVSVDIVKRVLHDIGLYSQVKKKKDQY